MSIEGSAKTSFGYNYNLSLKLKAQSMKGVPIPPWGGNLFGIIIAQKSQKSNSKFVKDQ